MVLLEGAGIDVALAFANEIRSTLAAESRADHLPSVVTVSGGCAMLDPDSSDVVEAIALADAQLAGAKRAGRNRVAAAGPMDNSAEPAA